MPRQPKADGFAQIIALSGLAILGGIIATLQIQTIGAIHTQSALQQTMIDRIAASSATRRIFAAIENDDDALEYELLGAGEALVLREAGTDVTLHFEDEGEKISAIHLTPEVLRTYFFRMGADLDPQEIQLPPASTRDLRRAVTTALLESGATADFDSDFTRYHNTEHRGATQLPDRGNASRNDAFEGLGFTGSAQSGQSGPTTWSLAVSLSGQIPHRSTFSVTAGNRVFLYGTN